MARAAATALAPALRIRERDTEAEDNALKDLAAWAGRFTPNVSLVSGFGPQGLLLEVSGSLNLFGSPATIACALAKGAAELGYTAFASSAPVAYGAWLLARGGSPSHCDSLAHLSRRLQPLPVEVLDCDPRTLASLDAIGVRTLGELLVLPRNGLARRYGQPVCDALDKALGIRADPREYFSPPEKFHAGIELPADVIEAEALVFALRRLIVQLGGFLEFRKGGVQRLRIDLFHKEACTPVEIGLVRPGRDVEHFVLLVREKLATLKLRQAVRRIALSADDIFSIVPQNADLLDESLKSSGDWQGLIERLRARLGNHAVSGVATEAAHRPEAAWRVCEPGESNATLEYGTRPLWLLPQPKRLETLDAAPRFDGPLSLLAGPERIESGWWDGRDAERDYYVARAETESLLWVYRDRHSEKGHWYLHGIFG
jgi:protein ImuB